MIDTVILSAPPGTDEVSFGEMFYRVDPQTRTIAVPKDIAHQFHVAGFREVAHAPGSLEHQTAIERHVSAEPPTEGSPVLHGAEELIAPEHLCGTTLQLSDRTSVTVPSDGIVAVSHTIEMDRSPGIEGVTPPKSSRVTGHAKELIGLGFRRLPARGFSRPERGRYVGDFYFDQGSMRPVWWSAGQWRDALGQPV